MIEIMETHPESVRRILLSDLEKFFSHSSLDEEIRPRLMEIRDYSG